MAQGGIGGLGGLGGTGGFGGGPYSHGANGSSILTSGEVFTPVGAGSWTPLAAMPNPYLWDYNPTAPGAGAFGGVAATGQDGQVYVIGGWPNSALPSGQVWAYDATTNSWSKRASSPFNLAAFHASAATAPDGRIFVFGGLALASATDSAFTAVYSPATNSWSSAAAMPAARWGTAAVTADDGQIYVFGGFDFNFSGGPAIQAQSTNIWTSKAAMPTARGGLAAVQGNDGRIYVFGGGDGRQLFTEINAYDPAANTWTAVGHLATARNYAGGALGADGRIYAIGGSINASPDLVNGNGSLNSVEVLNIPQAAIAEPALVVTPGAVAATEGATVVNAILATFTDPGGPEALSEYSATVNWGDGASENATITLDAATQVFAVQGTRTFRRSGGIILVTLRHGSAAEIYVSAGQVADVPITPTGSLTFTGVEGSASAVQTVATFVDPAGAQAVSLAWNNVANGLNVARAGAAAVTAPDGRIFVLCGSADGTLANPTASMEVYDPATGAWSFAPSLLMARTDTAATLGPDGRIYALGGGLYDLRSAEVYNIALQRWDRIAAIGQFRYGLAAAGAAGKVYAIGGVNQFGSALSMIEAYDPNAGTWRSVASMPFGLYAPSAVTGADGQIYVFGGSKQGLSSGNPSGSNTALVSDPGANAWTALPNMPTARFGTTAVLGDDGRIYVTGGRTVQGGPSLTTVEIYDPATQTWSSGPPLGTARFLAAATLGADGQVYTIGGVTSATAVNSVEALTVPAPNVYTATID